LSIEEQEKLLKSLLSKVPQSSYKEISINKFFKKILNQIAPIVTNPKLWRILSELEKPIKPQLSDWNNIRSTNIPKRSNEKAKLPIKNDFETRVKQQQMLNDRDFKILQVQDRITRDQNRFNRLLIFLNRRPRNFERVSIL